jgi:predicted transcriptional regulator
MRTLIDLPERDLRALTELAASRGMSRAALMREAVEDYLARQRPLQKDDAFGLWRSGEDGLAYQERLREEW